MKKLFLFMMIFFLFSLTSCSFVIPGLESDEQTKEVNNEIEEETKNDENNITDDNVETNNKNEDDNATNNGDNNNNQGNEALLGKDYYDEKNTASLYSKLFDINNKVVVKVNISETEIAKIEADYQKYGSDCNIYRLADSVQITVTDNKGLVVADSTLKEVGIRMKGNTTRHSFYDNGITSLIHFKLDFQETFDDSSVYSSKEMMTWNDASKYEDRKNRTFFGLRGLELKYNAEGDLTYTRDVYTSMVYKKYGIYAQSTTLGVLDFNIGNNTSKSGTLGVYKIYEPVDRVFIKRYFAEDNNDGDLYKASWGKAKGMPSLNSASTSSYGIDEGKPGVQKSVSYDLKTNKTKSNHEYIAKFLKWINGTSSDLNSTVKRYINEDYYATWLAIMYITGDWDNFMYDSNNYYMYFDESGLCYFIPYDMDRTFGLQAKMHNMANLKPLDKWNLQGSGNRSKLLQKTIDLANTTTRTKYLAKIKEISKDVLDTKTFTKYYDIIYANYKDDVLPTMKTLVYEYEDKTSNPFYHLIIGDGLYIKYNDSTSNNNAFDSYVSKKQAVIDANC